MNTKAYVILFSLFLAACGGGTTESGPVEKTTPVKVDVDVDVDNDKGSDDSDEDSDDSDPVPVVTNKTLTVKSNESGSARSDGTVLGVENVGDTSAGVGSQAFVSFDLSGIPADAVIQAVTVDFSSFDTLGNPFSGLGCLRMYSDNYLPLNAGDYFGGSPLGAVARWCSAGELSSSGPDSDVAAAVQGAVGGSRVEFRLHFNEIESNADGIGDMVRFGAIKLHVIYLSS